MFLKFRSLLLLSASLLCSHAAPTPSNVSWPTLQTDMDGHYVTLLNKAGFTALTVKPGDVKNTGFQYVGGNHLQPQTIEEGSNQQWQLKLVDGDKETWTLQNRQSGGYLEIDAGSNIVGKQAQAWGTRGVGDASANQEWKIYVSEDAGLDKYLSLQNVRGGLWLDLALNGNAYDWNPVLGWDWGKKKEGSAKWSFLWPDTRAD